MSIVMFKSLLLLLSTTNLRPKDLFVVLYMYFRREIFNRCLTSFFLLKSSVSRFDSFCTLIFILFCLAESSRACP